MPALSFTAEEVLPKLLSREKVQTIRPINKRRLKIGDIVTLYWRQRHSSQTFCRKCYMAVPVGRYNGKCLNCGHTDFFSKKLGRVMLTDVFEIEMIKETQGIYGSATMWRIIGKMFWNSDYIDDLANKDGFKSSNDMFKYFDNMYQIKDTMKFIVYRWTWLDES